MKTRVTLVTGEQFILNDVHYDDFVRSLTNQLGLYIIKMIKLNNIYVNTSHIVKVEKFD